MLFSRMTGLSTSARNSLLRLVLICACVMIAGCQPGNEEDSSDEVAEIWAAMLAATQQATADLEALAEKELSRDQMFDEVKKVTESHIRGMVVFGERFNALPSSTRKAFTGSAVGAHHEKRMNEELARMKALAYELVKDVPTFPLDFGMLDLERATELLQGTDTWPTEKRQVIDAKHGFVRMFLLGFTNFSGEQRGVMLTRIDKLRREALKGDGVATAELNGILKKIIKVYPKDEAAAQYNLGVLYSDIGERAEAEKWLSKAASQGLQQAAAELERLRSKR